MHPIPHTEQALNESDVASLVSLPAEQMKKLGHRERKGLSQSLAALVRAEA